IDDPIAAMRPVEMEPGEWIADRQASAAATVAANGTATATDAALAVVGAPASEAAPLETPSSAIAAPVDSAGPADDPAHFRLRNYRPHLSPDLSSVGGVASY